MGKICEKVGLEPCSAEREMSASACTRCMAGSLFYPGLRRRGGVALSSRRVCDAGFSDGDDGADCHQASP